MIYRFIVRQNTNMFLEMFDDRFSKIKCVTVQYAKTVFQRDYLGISTI